MKGKLLIAFLPAVLFYASSCQQKIGNIDLKTGHDTVSYLIGYNIGSSLLQSPMTDFNQEAFLKGLQEGMAEEELFTDENTANTIIGEYMRAQELDQSMQFYEEGVAFLEKNKAREEITTTESGLQYEVLVEGTGPIPTDTDTVTVHYHGTLIDGTVFDSSVERGEPATFPLNQVIPGWTEVLQLMPVGSKWKVYIPTDLAYGINPRPGGVIKPNMALIFEIELLSIN